MNRTGPAEPIGQVGQLPYQLFKNSLQVAHPGFESCHTVHTICPTSFIVLLPALPRYGKYEIGGLSSGSASTICQDVLKSDNVQHKWGFIDSQRKPL